MKNCPTCHRQLPVLPRIACPLCGKEVAITHKGNYNTHNRIDGNSYWMRRKCPMSLVPIEEIKSEIFIQEGI